MKSETPITDAAAMSVAAIQNSTASKMANFVPVDVARDLELELRELKRRRKKKI